jgi:hypothetical protein
MSMMRRGAAVALLMIGPVGMSVAYFPSPEVEAALTSLAASSVPHPLPGDVEVAEARYRHDADCEVLRQQYLEADAPVPAGSEVTVDTYGNLQVEAPFGPAAVIVADTGDGDCDYQIAASHTLVVEAEGIEPVGAFSNTLCASFLGYNFVGGEYQQTGQPWSVFAIEIDPAQHSWQIAVGPGRFEEMMASGEDPGPGALGGTLTTTMADGLLTGENASLRVELRCTPYHPFATSG